MSDAESEGESNLDLLDDRIPETDKSIGPVRRAAPGRTARKLEEPKQVKTGNGRRHVTVDWKVALDPPGRVFQTVATRGFGGFMFFMLFSCF